MKLVVFIRQKEISGFFLCLICISYCSKTSSTLTKDIRAVLFNIGFQAVWVKF